MRAQRLPASRGLAWIAEGFSLFRVAPVRQLLLNLAVLFGLFLLVGVPKIGFLLVWLFVPALVIGPHAVARSAAQGQTPGFDLLREGFRDDLPALLKLGAVFLAAMVLVFAATTLADGGRLLQALAGGQPIRPEEFRTNDDLMDAVLVATVLQTGLLGLLWHAPLLVAWNRIPLMKALFFSAAATLINWRAFLVYGIAFTMLFTLVLLVALMTSVLMAGVGALQSGSPIVTAMWTLLPVWFAGSFISYRDVFGPPAGEPGSAPESSP